MKRTISAALCAVLTTGLLTGCGSGDTAYITVAKVKHDQPLSAVSYDGTIASVQSVSIIPNVSGKVAAVAVNLGQQVKKDDVLFVLEDTDAKLQLQQAQASLASAQAAYSKTAGASTKQSETQMRQALEQAQNELRNAQNNYNSTKQQYDAGTAITPAQEAYDSAKADYDRIAWLVSVGEESRFALDNAKSKMLTAKAQLDTAKTSAKTAMDNADSRLKNARTAMNAAQENLSLTVGTVNPANIKGAQTQIDSAQAAVDIAQKRVNDTVVKAPIDGFVASKNIKAGDMASPQAAAMTILNQNGMEMVIHVTETYIAEVKTGQAADITLKGTGKTVKGTVTAAAPSADSKTGLYDVKISVDNQNGALREGMLASAKFTQQQENLELYVPKQSVANADGKDYVYVVNGMKLTKTEVTAGSGKNRYVAVTGLKDSDEVVVEGIERVRENGKFHIISSGN